MLIEDPAGVGKTTLLFEGAREARNGGFLVRIARAGELERGVGFGMARQLFEPIIERASRTEKTRLLPGSVSLALMAIGLRQKSTPPRSTRPDP